MVFVRECQPKLEELFYPTEEKRVERFLALNLSNSNQQFASLECLYSCKFFRIFYKRAKKSGIEISISKKFFRLAVERNKTKRRYRKKNIDGNFRGSEDIFFRKVRDGFIEFLKSPFK